MHVAGDEDGTDGANVRRFLADVEVILISEPVLAGGVHAARNGRSAAGEEHHDVFAEIREVALVAGAEALAEADQQEERADTPGDAEHGEERTQLVRPEGAENLRENVEHHLHGRDNSRTQGRLLAFGSQLSATLVLIKDSKGMEWGTPRCFRLSVERILAGGEFTCSLLPLEAGAWYCRRCRFRWFRFHYGPDESSWFPG